VGPADDVLTNPPFGKKQHHDHQWQGETAKGRAEIQPPGFLGHHLEQTAQFCSARPHHAQNHEPGGSGRSGQRAV